ncbi:hypothetical protein SUDANB140_03724 [Streptomyces sp. enrichment culture]
MINAYSLVQSGLLLTAGSAADLPHALRARGDPHRPQEDAGRGPRPVRSRLADGRPRGHGRPADRGPGRHGRRRCPAADHHARRGHADLRARRAREGDRHLERGQRARLRLRPPARRLRPRPLLVGCDLPDQPAGRGPRPGRDRHAGPGVEEPAGRPPRPARCRPLHDRHGRTGLRDHLRPRARLDVGPGTGHGRRRRGRAGALRPLGEPRPVPHARPDLLPRPAVHRRGRGTGADQLRHGRCAVPADPAAAVRPRVRPAGGRPADRAARPDGGAAELLRSGGEVAGPAGHAGGGAAEHGADVGGPGGRCHADRAGLRRHAAGAAADRRGLRARQPGHGPRADERDPAGQSRGRRGGQRHAGGVRQRAGRGRTGSGAELPVRGARAGHGDVAARRARRGTGRGGAAVGAGRVLRRSGEQPVGRCGGGAARRRGGGGRSVRAHREPVGEELRRRGRSTHGSGPVVAGRARAAWLVVPVRRGWSCRTLEPVRSHPALPSAA